MKRSGVSNLNDERGRHGLNYGGDDSPGPTAVAVEEEDLESFPVYCGEADDGVASRKHFSERQETRLDAPIVFSAHTPPTSVHSGRPESGGEHDEESPTIRPDLEAVAIVDEDERIRQAEDAGRRQVLAEIVEADVEPLPEKSKEKLKHFWLVAALLIVVVIIAVPTAIVTSRSEPADIQPLQDPQSDDCIRQRCPGSGSSRPVDVFPSPSPTMRGTGATECRFAVPLRLDGDSVKGYLGDTDASAMRCSGSVDAFDANWYSLSLPEKFGETLVSAQVCNAKQSTSIFVGEEQQSPYTMMISTGSCESDRQCVPPEFLESEPGQPCTKAAWLASPGEIYHITVGNPISLAKRDSIGIPNTPAESDTDMPPSVTEPSGEVNVFAMTEGSEPKNLFCQSASRIALASNPDRINFALFQSFSSSISTFVGCDGIVKNQVTSWHKFTGNGMGALLWVCSEGRVSVDILGGGCESEIDVPCKNVGRRLVDGCEVHSFLAELEEEVFIAIQSLEPEPPSSDVIIFLGVNEAQGDALYIDSLPFSHNGNTEFATFFTDRSRLSCSDVEPTDTYSSWYIWAPDQDGCVEVTARRGSSQFFDPALFVYSSTSGARQLNCIGKSENMPVAVVRFDPVKGEEYFIQLTDTDGDSGDFGLSITQNEGLCSPLLRH